MPRLGSFSSRALTGIGLSILAPVVGPEPMILEAVVDQYTIDNNISNYVKLGSIHDVEINWGDGTVNTSVSVSAGSGIVLKMHQYTQAGTYTITISGDLPHFGTELAVAYTPTQGVNFITRVLQWNSTTTDLRWAFEAQQLLTEVPATLPSGVTDLTGAFWGCSSFGNTPPDVRSPGSGFNYTNFYGASISSIQIMDLSVDYQAYFNSVASINGRKMQITWPDNTSIKATIVSNDWVANNDQTFISIEIDFDTVGYRNDAYIITIVDEGTIDDWDVGNVTDMSYMFAHCSLMDLYLGSWNVSSVTNMSNMFVNAQFRGIGVELWNVSSVTDMSYMFYGTAISAPIGVWDVSNVTNMSHMFENVVSFNQLIGGWHVSSVTDMNNMFMVDSSYSINLLYSIFNQNLTGWSVPLITQAPTNFFSPDGPAEPVAPIWGSTQTSLDTVFNGDFADLYFFSGNGTFPNAVIDWGDGVREVIPGANVNNGMYTHSYADGQITTRNITVTGYLPNMQGGTIYYGSPVAPTTTGMTGVSQWNSTMVNLNGAFEHRTALTSVPNYLPLGVTTITAMFIETASFNDPNVIQWDVSNITSMYGMFSDSLAFNQDLSSWNVENLTDQWTNSGYGSLQAPAGILDRTKWPIWGTTGLPDNGSIWGEAVDFIGGGSSNWHDGSFGPGTQLTITTKSNNTLAARLRTGTVGDELRITVVSSVYTVVTITSTFSEGTPDSLGYITFTAQVAETSAGFDQLLSVIVYYSNAPATWTTDTNTALILDFNSTVTNETSGRSVTVTSALNLNGGTLPTLTASGTFNSSGAVVGAGRLILTNGSLINFSNWLIGSTSAVWTIEFWFKLASGNTRALTMLYVPASGNSRIYGLFAQADGTLTLMNANGSPSTVQSYKDDTWHHVSIVKNTSIGVYWRIDGVFVARLDAWYNDPQSGVATWIGNSYGQTPTAGDLHIDNVRISNTMRYPADTTNVAATTPS